MDSVSRRAAAGAAFMMPGRLVYVRRVPGATIAIANTGERDGTGMGFQRFYEEL